jgi:hypothetical protein
MMRQGNRQDTENQQLATPSTVIRFLLAGPTCPRFLSSPVSGGGSYPLISLSVP